MAVKNYFEGWLNSEGNRLALPLGSNFAAIRRRQGRVGIDFPGVTLLGKGEGSNWGKVREHQRSFAEAAVLTQVDEQQEQDKNTRVASLVVRRSAFRFGAEPESPAPGADQHEEKAYGGAEQPKKEEGGLPAQPSAEAQIHQLRGSEGSERVEHLGEAKVLAGPRDRKSVV